MVEMLYVAMVESMDVSGAEVLTTRIGAIIWKMLITPGKHLKQILYIFYKRVSAYIP
jgi:hypothetical protein